MTTEEKVPTEEIEKAKQELPPEPGDNIKEGERRQKTVKDEGWTPKKPTETLEKMSAREVGIQPEHDNLPKQAAFKNEGIWMYGIDTLDQNNPTAKDQIYTALEGLDRQTQKSSDDPETRDQQIRQTFGSLLGPREKGEQVREGDLLATYDALSLRINNLQEKGVGSVDQQIFGRKRDLLKQYLSTNENLDLRPEATDGRLNLLAVSLEENSRGLTSARTSGKFRRLVRRAASLEVYGGETAQSDLNAVQGSLSTYPQEESAFRRAMVEESLYGLRLPSAGGVMEQGVTQTPMLNLEQEIAGYEHAELVLSEVQSALDELKQLELEDILSTILLGSAARKELRTKEHRLDDPSHIDLLVIVSEDDLSVLDKLMQQGDIRLSRSKTASGSTFYIIKRPSASGRLGETEVMICTREGFKNQLKGAKNESQTKFVKDAVSEGLIL
jgi:hypothetical protein